MTDQLPNGNELASNDTATAKNRKRIFRLSILMTLYVCGMVAMFWLIQLALHKNNPDALLLGGIILAVPLGWRATFGRNKFF